MPTSRFRSSSARAWRRCARPRISKTQPRASGELQEQWRDAADVPRAQADALWRRFKTAHDEVWARCEAHFAAQAAERADNLARKTALCEKAEALADSTDWIQTSEAMKALQAEWKTIGRGVARPGKGDLGAVPHRLRSLLHPPS